MARPGWFLTSFATGRDYIIELGHMLDTFALHHPGVPAIVGINPCPQRAWGDVTNFKAEWLEATWAAWSCLGDMVWVDADARFRRPIEVPEGDFDIGAKQYQKDRVSTGTLWFRDSCGGVDATLALWTDSADQHDCDEISFTAALEEMAVSYQELPDSLTSVCSLGIHKFAGKIETDSAIVHWNRSRRELGHVLDWPPSEDERDEAMR